MTNEEQANVKSPKLPLPKDMQEKVLVLIEKCILSQRRLEYAIQFLQDKAQNETATMILDIKSYRRVLVENKDTYPETVPIMETIRIVEKAMHLMAPRIDNVCIIAGNEDSQPI